MINLDLEITKIYNLIRHYYHIQILMFNFKQIAKLKIMITEKIRRFYDKIFESYGHESLEKHIEKIIELDKYLPYSSTFFCITNTQSLSFEYISKNMQTCLGLDPKLFMNKECDFFGVEFTLMMLRNG